MLTCTDESFCSIGGAPSPPAGNTSSTNSSRDSSPCREGFAPLSIQNHGYVFFHCSYVKYIEESKIIFFFTIYRLLQMSKPPMVIRRGSKGFGFTIHTIRVYYGESDYYTMQHLVSVSFENHQRSI